MMHVLLDLFGSASKMMVPVDCELLTMSSLRVFWLAVRTKDGIMPFKSSV